MLEIATISLFFKIGYLIPQGDGTHPKLRRKLVRAWIFEFWYRFILCRIISYRKNKKQKNFWHHWVSENYLICQYHPNIQFFFHDHISLWFPLAVRLCLTVSSNNHLLKCHHFLRTKPLKRLLCSSLSIRLLRWHFAPSPYHEFWHVFYVITPFKLSIYISF